VGLTHTVYSLIGFADSAVLALLETWDLSFVFGFPRNSSDRLSKAARSVCQCGNNSNAFYNWYKTVALASICLLNNYRPKWSPIIGRPLTLKHDIMALGGVAEACCCQQLNINAETDVSLVAGAYGKRYKGDMSPLKKFPC